MKSLSIDWRRVAYHCGSTVPGGRHCGLQFARLEELDRLNRQADITRAEATQAALTKIALETKVAYAGSDQIVEEQARSEGHMIQEGDQPDQRAGG